MEHMAGLSWSRDCQMIIQGTQISADDAMMYWGLRMQHDSKQVDNNKNGLLNE